MRSVCQDSKLNLGPTRCARLDAMAVSGRARALLLERQGFDFFAGVPCSLIEDLIAVLEAHPTLPYIPVPREDVAVGLAAGAWFAGRRPAVVMQNSGLGTSLNALASLSLMYGLPALLIVTWRGFGGQDAPEHLLMGEISPKLLDLLGIPYRVLRPESADELLIWARREMDARETPVAILVPPGIVATGAAHSDGAQPPRSSERAPRGPATPAPTPAQIATTPSAADEELPPVISRREAIAVA